MRPSLVLAEGEGLGLNSGSEAKEMLQSVKSLSSEQGI